MKNKSLLLASALLLFTFVIGCKKENNLSNTSTPTGQNVALGSGDYCSMIHDDIGIIHNQALAYAFEKIQDENLFEGVTDTPQVIALMTQLTTEYLNSYFDYTYTEEFTSEVVNTVMTNPYPTSSFSDVFNQKMATMMAEYYAAENVDEYRDFAVAFLDDNIDLIPENEQVAFRSAVLVSFNSWEYWEENMLTWINEYNRQNDLPPVSGKFDARACGKADIEGVVGGAIGGIGGGLVGVCLGAAFGGPIGSGVNAVFQCFW
jgi:hypothetical protein